MGGGGGSSGTVRYASYLEAAHKSYLLEYRAILNNALETESPYADYEKIDVDTAFLGAGVALSHFPALFDVFMNHMKDFDTDKQYTQDVAQMLNSQNLKDLVSAEGAILRDDLDEKVLPKFNAGCRDIGAVLSSSFVIGRANLEADRLKQLEKFSTGLKHQMLPTVIQKWQTSLEWNRSNVQVYMQIMQLYFAGQLDMTNAYYEAKSKTALWPFELLDYYKAGLGAMQGAVSTTSSSGGPSTASKAIGGALTGAATGAMIGSVVPGIGTGIGAVVGGVVGLAGGLLA